MDALWNRLRDYWEHRSQWVTNFQTAFRTGIEQLTSTIQNYFHNIFFPTSLTQNEPIPSKECPSILLPMCIGDKIYDQQGCVVGVKCRKDVI